MIDQALNDKKTSILLMEQGERTDIVIGAPHHTLGGIEHMPCDEHKPGDENTGFIARAVAKLLNASFIIACNYRIDPNKKLSTDYARIIEKWAPKYLIEIHGHGGAKISRNNVEISSGNIERNEISKKFASILQAKFQTHADLKTFKVCGDFNNIYYKASESKTITCDKWIPLHIELPPSIRKNKDNGLPDYFDAFNDFLAQSIKEIMPKVVENIQLTK